VEQGEQLRSLMRRLPTPVAVVTTEVDGRRYGITVGSLLSLSLEPALVGMSISRDTQLNSLLRESDVFAVSALAGDQDWIAQHFARSVPPLVLWNGIPLRDADGPPQIEGALGWLTCRRRESIEVGTHTLFVGEVLEVEDGRPGPALLYAHRSYHAL
jgi:3-hydroxy-9,10-secoandrosta-1,3,5(10)-triene-9,17-dione monooxygenase reductase component